MNIDNGGSNREQTPRPRTAGERIRDGMYTLAFPLARKDESTGITTWGGAIGDFLVNGWGTAVSAVMVANSLGVDVSPSTTPEEYAKSVLIIGGSALALKAATLIWGLGNALGGDNHLNKE